MSTGDANQGPLGQDGESDAAGGLAPAPPTQISDEMAWYRVHRATPFVRGWIILAAVAVAILQQNPQELVEDGIDAGALIVLAGTVLGVALIVVAYGWLSWRKMAFAYDSESVYMNRGILFRQERKVRLDRIQAIDIVRPLVARILGLAELTIQSASGGDGNVAIGFLKDKDAEQLRIELLARASGALAAAQNRPTISPQSQSTTAPQNQPGTAAQSQNVEGASAVPAFSDQGHETDSQPAPVFAPFDAPERVIFSVPPKHIIGGGLLSFATIFTTLVVLVMIITIVAGAAGAAAAFIPALLAVGPLVWNRFVGEYGFTAAISADGIRVRHGLLETRAKTIPPGRVQAIQIRQPLLWRKPGWWRVDVNVAGQAVEVNGQNINLEAVLLPVGTVREAIDALWLVLPDLGTHDPLGLLEHALRGRGEDGGFTVSPRSARWLDWLSYRRNGFVVTDRALIIRTGWMVRRVVVVPHERMQSIGAEQGPWQRRLGVATFTVHSTVGNISPELPHQSEQVVRDLLVTQANRAREARSQAGPEHWLESLAALPQAAELLELRRESSVPAPSPTSERMEP